MRAHRIALFIGSVFCGTTGAALADGVRPPLYGGEVETLGPLHAEVSVGEGELEVYLTDAGGRPLSFPNARALALVASGGAYVPVPLAPVKGNELRGTGPFDNTPEMEILLGLQIDTGRPLVALFDEPR